MACGTNDIQLALEYFNINYHAPAAAQYPEP
jgi:hypothetical protein